MYRRKFTEEQINLINSLYYPNIGIIKLYKLFIEQNKNQDIITQRKFRRLLSKMQIYKNACNQSGKGTIKISSRTKLLQDVLSNKVKISSGLLKRKLLNYKLKEYKCQCCNTIIWQGKEITLELHHIDGNKFNNNLDNLQILCPNCHSQTINYRNWKK